MENRFNGCQITYQDIIMSTQLCLAVFCFELTFFCHKFVLCCYVLCVRCDTKGAFFWDYSGIGILGIDSICVLLGAIPFSE